MKSSHRLAFLGLPLLASIFQGCGCAHHRQIVYPGRRKAPVQVNPRDGVRVKAPFVDVDVPPSKVDAYPYRIDVPMIEPN